MGRPSISKELQRRLLVEAGHRCAIPSCRTTSPLEFEHIEEWSKVQKHEFENMLVLCANCHGRKGDRSGQIDKKALRVYKQNLGLINSRYIDFERRVIEYFATACKNSLELEKIGMELPTGNYFFVKYLVDDGFLQMAGSSGLMTDEHSTLQIWTLTASGVEFVRNYYEAKLLEG